MSQAITQSATVLSPRRGRSVSAVLVGFVTVLVLSIGTDAVLHATRVYPPLGVRMSDGLFWLASAYRCAYTVLGGYLCARLSPTRPERHALILGAIGFVAATLGAVATWGRADLGPAWYPLLLVATALPCTLAGAKLFSRRPLAS